MKKEIKDQVWQLNCEFKKLWASVILNSCSPSFDVMNNINEMIEKLAVNIITEKYED